MARLTHAPRAVIAGAGLMGRWHAHACRHAGGRVVAVVDPDQDAARKLARSFRAVAARTLDEARAAGAIDVAHICTPAENHEQDATHALSLRVPLIVEKPIAQTAEATERLLSLAHDAGVWIQPVHQLLFQDGIRQAGAWAARCGGLWLFDYRLCSAGAETTGASAERLAADVLPHPLSLIDGFVVPDGLGALRDLTVHHTGPGELSFVAVAGQTLCRVFISTHGRPPRHELLLVSGTGTLTADLFHGFSWTDSTRSSRARKATRPLSSSGAILSRASSNLVRRALNREFAFPGLAAFVAGVYKAMATGGRPPLEDAHALAVARRRDEILSARGVVA